MPRRFSLTHGNTFLKRKTHLDGSKKPTALAAEPSISEAVRRKREEFIHGVRRGSEKSVTKKRGAWQRAPKYYLKYFSDEARRHWWKTEASTSSDLRIRLYLFFEEPDSWSAAFASLLIVLCILSMQALMAASTHLAESDERSRQLEANLFTAMAAFNAIFSFEIVLRFVALSAPVAVIRKRAELFHQLGWLMVDLVAVVAFWVQFLLVRAGDGAVDYDWLDILGAFRVFRVLHALARWPSLSLMARTLSQSLKALATSFSILVVMAIFFGACLYYVESLLLPPEEEMAFTEMTLAIWFFLVTFSTVGYGDVAPKTYGGRAITLVAIFIAMVTVAMPITIVGAHFQSAWEEREKARIVSVIQKGMVDQHMRVEDVVGLFSLQDTSGDGSISYVEFMTMLRNLNLILTPQEGRTVFGLFDEDGNGTISYSEFVNVVFPSFDVESLSKVEMKKTRGAHATDLARASRVSREPPQDARSAARGDDSRLSRAQLEQKKESLARAEQQLKELRRGSKQSPPGTAGVGTGARGADGATGHDDAVLSTTLLEEMRTLASTVSRHNQSISASLNGLENRLQRLEVQMQRGGAIGAPAPAPGSWAFGA